MSTSSSTSSETSPSTPLGKLKEPRDLYSTATLLHPIKWPVECQVIPEKIRHIDSVPSKLEPFYTPTGKEPQPQPVGIEMGTVVYDYQPKLSVDYFCRATVGGSQELDNQQFEMPTGESSLKFESRFESGNLAKAIKITNTYYELYLRPDLYTERHAQWFYFKIQGCKEGVQYRFSIVNLNKPDSLYRYGLKVLMYSEKEALLNGVGWTRCGQNIAYFKNDISMDDNGPYYTLTFNLKFRYNNDVVYLAQCYPYTYSTLQNYLKTIEDDEFKSQLLTIRLLCRSLAGNNVHVLTVTSPDNHHCHQQQQQQHQQGNNNSGNTTPTANAEGEEIATSNKKPVIVISARVHPGETQSSYMMKGIIDFLTSDCTQAKELRDRFIFKLIPMLNPDGVIVGNSRCCLLGQDLNRQYRTVLREAFPQIYHVKVMLRRLQEENGIFLYCDLHGHSRRHNVFIYGCENRRVPEKHLMEQVFPLMMHKNAADKFSFQNCKFKIQKNKEGTGRIFVWTLGVVNSYTLEISLGGSTMPSRQYTHFNTGDYEACGRHFCETLLDYSDPSPGKESLRDRILTKLIDEGSTADEPKNVVLSDYSSLSHSETEGDDNDNDEDDSEREDDFSEKKASNPNKKELKRQVSIRKHHQNQVRAKITASLKTATRSPMPLHRASVDFTKFKQRKLEESFVQPNPSPQRPSTPENCPAQHENSTTGSDSKTKEMSAAYRRLTKFRRKQRKSINVSVSSPGQFSDSLVSPQQQPQQLQLTAKCTRILFDDPFNPPGTTWNRPQQYSRRQPIVPITLNGEALSLVGLDMDCYNSNSGWQSGTEDECDPYDDMPVIMRREPPKIKITDCDDESPYGGSDSLQTLAGDMSRLRINKDKLQRSSSDTETDNQSQFPTFAPFTPSLPVGKAFLHQNFYPDKPTSPQAQGKPKLTNSLSDTTLAEKDASNSKTTTTSSGGLTPNGSGAPIVRRSSISYGAISRTANKLLATGSPLTPKTGATLSAAADPNSRRRVSWTGTLTVSVPTTIPILPKSPVRNPNPIQRKKSFRKSKSLNDKQSPGTSQQSSVDLHDSTSSLVGVPATSLNSVDRIGGASKGRLIKGPGYGHSLSTGSISTANNAAVGIPATSMARKKRAKLKRSKHK